MRRICRAMALTAVILMAALVMVAVSACSGATTTSSPTTNGLEKKSAADVLKAAAGALRTAASVHIIGSGSGNRLDLRMTGDSSAGTFEQGGVPIEATIIGGTLYVKADQAGLQKLGIPQPVQRQYAGRWLNLGAQDSKGLTIANFASQLTAHPGRPEPKVRQAMLNGRKVVVISWKDGGKLHVANTGPAYPLRVESTGQDAGVVNFTEYGAPVHITAPSNAIAVSGGGNNAASSNPATPAATPATPTGPAILSQGQPALITQEGSDAGSVTVTSVKTSMTPAEPEFGSKPENGYFVVARVSVTVDPNFTKGFDISPVDFYVLNGSTHYSEGNGNSFDALGSSFSELDTTTLGAGQKTSGPIVFDVSAPHGYIVYAPNLNGQPLAEWKY
jgi:Domain of unknown function (DUF4352)